MLTIFTRLALSAISPLLRRLANDSVPPMQISARGRVIAARYSPDACNQPGKPILNTANGTAARTLMISGFLTTLLQMLHGSDLITGLYTASTMVDRVL